ncbi:MAG: disulfide bond formation protein B [Candidatus Korarchaeota archaeon]|nr:disulfide bond formation protein B [Candidatus Korarchaeota archaeon]
MSTKAISLTIAFIALVGILLSFYTEFVQGIRPCLSCYTLRFSYIAIFLISLAYFKFKRASYLILAISLLIIGISSWGILGFLGYQSNPCIEACTLSIELNVSYRLFSLALLGGIIELVLALLLIRYGS